MEPVMVLKDQAVAAPSSCPLKHTSAPTALPSCPAPAGHCPKAWLLCSSELGGPCSSPVPEGLDAGVPEGVPAGPRARLQGMGWHGMARDRMVFPRWSLTQQRRDPSNATSPWGSSPQPLLAVPRGTFAPESCRGGSDPVHPAPSATPRRLLIGL